MKLTILFAALFVLPAMASSYDSSWYKADGWSGEYPNGFSVIKKNVVVKGRESVDLNAPASISCGLPIKAVFHPWNAKRKAAFVSMSKIVLLTVKEDFVFESDETKIDLKKGDVIEYLVYGAEGWFTVRINGKEYGADQSLFEKVEEVAEGAFHQDEWIQVPCKSGKKAWLLLADLVKVNADGELVYLPGLDGWSKGFVEYGVVRDLKNKDL